MNISHLAILFMILVHATALLLLSFFSVRLIRNLRFLSRSRTAKNPIDHYPSVSVLVPARNEEQNIQNCLKSLAQQDYPEFDILVLDDQSSDQTLERIRQIANQYPMIQILQGDTSPPPGWNGKSFACHRLAERAQSEWLLFTDADTVHSSQSIRQGIEQAHALEVDLLSAMPFQITKTWSEHLLVSFIMDFLALLRVDLENMWQGKTPQAIANGQYVLVRRSAYQAVGGHAAVATKLIDDFALANRFRSEQRRIAMINGTTILKCRMYKNAREVWQGFSKNMVLSLLSGMHWHKWQAFLFAWGFASVFVLPLVLAILLPSIWIAWIEVCWLIGLRMVTSIGFRRSPIEAIFTALSAIGVMIIGVNALRMRFMRQTVSWKDRHYDLTS